MKSSLMKLDHVSTFSGEGHFVTFILVLKSYLADFSLLKEGNLHRSFKKLMPGLRVFTSLL